jgi:hypothetical protein
MDAQPTPPSAALVSPQSGSVVAGQEDLVDEYVIWDTEHWNKRIRHAQDTNDPSLIREAFEAAVKYYPTSVCSLILHIYIYTHIYIGIHIHIYVNFINRSLV